MLCLLVYRLQSLSSGERIAVQLCLHSDTVVHLDVDTPPQVTLTRLQKALGLQSPAKVNSS